jgi:hypothetical protein
MKGKWKYFWLYAGFLVIGFLWLNDINTKGYYSDSKHGFHFYGNEARLTAHLVIVFSVVGMIYTIVTKRKEINTEKKPPNQAL